MVNARDLIEEVERRGVRFEIVGNQLRALGRRGTIDPVLSAKIGGYKASIVAELRVIESARALIVQAEDAGLELNVYEGCLRVRHRTNAAPDASILERLASAKLIVIAELLRRADLLSYAGDYGLIAAEPASSSPVLSPDGKMCGDCGRIDRCYDDDVRGYTCSACTEWRVAGCAQFTIRRDADEEAQAKRGACLACGASHDLHGRPPYQRWRRVGSLDDVQLVAVRYVVAHAASIARSNAS